MDNNISRATYRNGIKHSSVMAISMVVTIIFGFLPHIIIAKKIGLGNITDAYLMAISINQIFLKLIRVGTLPKIFVMALSDDFVGSLEKTKFNINNFLNIILLLSLFIMLISFLAAPVFVNIIAKGFDIDKKLATINIIRILIPSLFYQYFISLAEAIFKLRSEFSRWAILSMTPPFIITCFVYLFISRLGIYSVVYGTLVGFAIHFLLLVYFVYFKFHYPYRFQIDLKHDLLRKAVKLISPYYVSSIPVQIILGVQSFLVSMLPSGMASVFFYARRILEYIEQFSINIFSQLMLPYFTKKMAQSSIAHIGKVYGQLICITNYIHLPFLIILAALGRRIIDVLFASKLTNPELVLTLGAAFSLFMVFSLPSPSADVLANIVLSMKRTMWVNLVSISQLAVILILSLVLFKYFKFWGLIFSYSLINLQEFLINQVHLTKRYKFENILLNSRIKKIITLNVILAFFVYYLNQSLPYGFSHHFFYQKFAIIGIVLSLGVIFYGLLSYLFKVEELKFILSLIRKKPSEAVA